MSDLTSGYRRIPGKGNAGTNLHYLLKGITVGSYYWSVQTIDAVYAGGNWAPEQEIKVSDLRADFISDTVCLNTDTHFTDLSYSSGDPILSRHWDFGDGIVSTEINPTHTFSTMGSHFVKLIVKTLTSTDSITNNILVKPRPTVSL
jgi:PKD repeat protein